VLIVYCDPKRLTPIGWVLQHTIVLSYIPTRRKLISTREQYLLRYIKPQKINKVLNKLTHLIGLSSTGLAKAFSKEYFLLLD